MRQHDGVLHGHDLGRCEVGDVGCHAAGLEGLGHGGVVDQGVAAEVHDGAAGLGYLELVRADHAARGIHGGHVDGDVVAAMQDIVEVGDVLDGGGQAPGGLGGNVRVVAEHVHAQIDGGVGHQRADGAQTDDAERLAGDLLAGKGLLRLLGVLADGGGVGVLAAPGGAGQDAAACQQHAAQDELLHGVRVGAGGVEHDDAGFGALVERDVVHACAGAGDGEQAFGQVHVVHGGAAHEHAGGLRDVVGKLVVGPEQVGSLGGDVVQAVDVAHEAPFGVCGCGLRTKSSYMVGLHLGEVNDAAAAGRFGAGLAAGRRIACDSVSGGSFEDDGLFTGGLHLGRACRGVP